MTRGRLTLDTTDPLESSLYDLVTHILTTRRLLRIFSEVLFDDAGVPTSVGVEIRDRLALRFSTEEAQQTMDSILAYGGRRREH